MHLPVHGFPGHVLLGQAVVHDDFVELGVAEVLLGRALVQIELAVELVEGFQTVGVSAAGLVVEEVVARVVLLHDVVAGLLFHHHPGRRHAEGLHHSRQLLVLRGAGQKRQAEKQLGHNAPEGPHVDGGGVVHAEDHLGRAVEAGLHVGVEKLVLLAGAAEVDDLQVGLVQLRQQDVLWL